MSRRFNSVVVACLAVMIVLSGCQPKDNSVTLASGDATTTTSSASTSTTPTTAAPANPAQPDPELIAFLTVKTSDVYCPTTVPENGGNTMAANGQTVVKFNIGALKPVENGGRLWSDALSTPFGNADPQKMLAEMLATLCESPLDGITLARMLSNLKLGDTNLADLNDWLKPFGDQAGSVNTLAAGYTLLDVDLSKATLQQQNDAVAQNIAWQRVAEKLGTMLKRFSLVGVKAAQSAVNYHLAGSGLVVGGLPPVEANPVQENLPALVLDATNKGACAPVVEIGFNTGDKRPEVFVTPTCAPPAPAPGPGPGPAPTTPPAKPCKGKSCKPSGCTGKNCGSTATSTTQPSCGRKCTPATTSPPPPVTQANPGTTVPPAPKPTTAPPTTTAPKPSPPTTAAPPGGGGVPRH